MKYSKETIDLVIATINNGSVKVQHDYDKDELKYLFQGFSYGENENNIGYSFKQLCYFYEKEIKE